jgi:uncharacterized membrane-anchored protein YjiN (DUF445 family)
MTEKPFKEKKPAKGTKAAGAFAKSEVEDKLRQENADLLDKLKQLGDKQDPKSEKDEQADKYAKDYADIQKNSKDSKDSKDHKHEKSEKERKDIYKESEVGVFQGVNTPDPQIERRIAALENVVGQLAHFIPPEARPDLSRGALQQEPDQPPKSGGRRR